MPLVLPAPLRRVLPDRLVQPLRRLLWRLPNLRRCLPSGLQLTVESPADWTIYNDIFADGEYDEAIRACLDGAPADRPLAVLDLGANVGYFTLRLADAALRRGRPDFQIVAVEASPKLVSELGRRLLAQRSLADRVRLVQGLAGRRHGDGQLFESPLHFEQSVLPGHATRAVRAGYIDLAELVAAWPMVDLLKCDVEGAELELFETYQADLLPRVRRAVIELHHRLCDTSRCLDLLREAGFGPPQTLREAYGCSVVLVTRPELAS